MGDKPMAGSSIAGYFMTSSSIAGYFIAGYLIGGYPTAGYSYVGCHNGGYPEVNTLPSAVCLETSTCLELDMTQSHTRACDGPGDFDMPENILLCTIGSKRL